MQLSRPYQIVLGVIAVLGAAWMFVLRPHSSTPAPAPAAAVAPAPAAKTSLPGVNGLARAVAKAHGAVALSQRNAGQLAANSAAASSSTGGTAASPASAGKSASGRTLQPSPNSKAPTPATGTHAAAPADRSAEVSGPLKQGKVVVILFWDSRAADDQAVMHQLADVSRANGKVVVLEATPSQVASFGAVTRGVQVLETPTTMVIDHLGRATMLTGLTDATSIQQAISDAQRGAGAVQTPLFASSTTGPTRSQYIARANSLCRKPSKGVSVSGTVQQQVASFHQLAALALAQIGQLHAVPEPPADRVTLERWFGQLNRSMHEFDGSVSAGVAKSYASERNLLFAGQADFDRASQGLADYGLTACFSPESRTS